MERKYWFRIVLAAWVFFWIGLVYADIGEATEVLVYSWTTPLQMAAFMFVTAYLGFMSNAARKDDYAD